MKKVFLTIVVLLLLIITPCLVACIKKQEDDYNAINKMLTKDYSSITVTIEVPSQELCSQFVYTYNADNTVSVAYDYCTLAEITKDINGNWQVPENRVKTTSGVVTLMYGNLLPDRCSGDTLPNVDWMYATPRAIKFGNDCLKNASTDEGELKAQITNLSNLLKYEMEDAEGSTITVKYAESLQSIVINCLIKQVETIITYTFAL